MGAKLRTGALLAILAVLLGGLALTVWRADAALTQLLMGPLGLIVAALVWSEKRSIRGDDDEDDQDDEDTAGAKPARKKGSKDELE